MWLDMESVRGSDFKYMGRISSMVEYVRAVKWCTNQFGSGQDISLGSVVTNERWISKIWSQQICFKNSRDYTTFCLRWGE